MEAKKVPNEAWNPPGSDQKRDQKKKRKKVENQGTQVTQAMQHLQAFWAGAGGSLYNPAGRLTHGTHKTL